METFVAWIQDNHLPLLGTQLAVVMAVGLWILLRRIRAQEASVEAAEPSEGDRRTVVLPEEDAAQMFETLTALQEELERYRKPQPAAEAVSVLEEVTPELPDEAARFWEADEVSRSATGEMELPMEEAVTEKTRLAEERGPAEEEPTAADRVLRSWLEDVERLARRARRDSL